MREKGDKSPRKPRMALSSEVRIAAHYIDADLGGFVAVEMLINWTELLRGSKATGRVFGGAKRDRTADLLVANEALSQLSYSPTRREQPASV